MHFTGTTGKEYLPIKAFKFQQVIQATDEVLTENTAIQSHFSPSLSDAS